MAVLPSSRDRRVMFAMDFRDPVTGLGVTDLDVKAESLGPPIQPPSGRFVWLDYDPPAQRKVRVKAISRKKRFADFEEQITVPAHQAGTKAADLLFSRSLTPTGLYEPPEGLTGAAGWLVEDATKTAVKNARVAVAFRHDDTQSFTSAYQAVTDVDGRFVAVANDLGDIRPDPVPSDPHRPGIDLGVLAWLVVRRGSQTRYSGFQPLRVGRLVRFAEPFLWSALSSNPPQ
jgi:hypothetical protein